MNFIEKIVYDIVKENPKFKNSLRDLYQDLSLLVHSPKNESFAPIIVREGYFYGFHDVTPFSGCGRYLLAHAFDCDHVMPNGDERVSVGMFDLHNDHVFTRFGSTTAWNWHKGSRLQWVNSSTVIYNSLLEGGNLGSVIAEVHGKNRQTLPIPIDTVSPDGCRATTFDYKALEIGMPGYGYRISDEPLGDALAGSSDRIGEVDLATGDVLECLHVEDMTSVTRLNDMVDREAHRFFTHTNYSRCGGYIYFLFRRIDLEDVLKRQTELGRIDRLTGKVVVAQTSGMVSHYDVTADGNVLAYLSIDNESGHFLLDGVTLEVISRVGRNSLTSDGHQSCSRAHSEHFVVDSYPDRFRMANLYVGNTATKQVARIARLTSPKRFRAPNPYKHWVCDLHPRLSHDGRMVSFDSVHTGERSLCTMPIDPL